VNVSGNIVYDKVINKEMGENKELLVIFKKCVD
jgi:hypothetical protein